MTEKEIIASSIPLPVRLSMVRHGISFYQCIMECAQVPELVENFDRLNHTNLSRKGHPINVMIDEATGKFHADMEAFIEFVWECVFLRFGPEAEAHP